MPLFRLSRIRVARDQDSIERRVEYGTVVIGDPAAEQRGGLFEPPTFVSVEGLARPDDDRRRLGLDAFKFRFKCFK